MQNSIKTDNRIIRTIITVLFLLLTLVWSPLGLIGIILMWIWAKWPKWLKILISIPFGLFFLALALWTLGAFTYLFFFRPFRVAGAAMNPNYTNGMYLMTQVMLTDTVINRDEVIVFKSPKNPEFDYVQRVIGLPGESITLKSGEVYINGQKLDESKYITSGIQTFGNKYITEEQIINIPSGQYFTLGDNRPQSSDSREWGLVQQGNIIGKVIFCYWNCIKSMQ